MSRTIQLAGLATAAEDSISLVPYFVDPTLSLRSTVYVERFASSEYWDIVEATSQYRRQANALRLEAMPICEAAGNW